MSFKYSSKKDRDALVNIFKVVGDKSFTYSQIKHLLDSSQRLRVLYLKGYVKKIGRVSPYKPIYYWQLSSDVINDLYKNKYVQNCKQITNFC